MLARIAAVAPRNPRRTATQMSEPAPTTDNCNGGTCMADDVKPLETKTPKDVIHAAKERGAKIVDLRFIDLPGLCWDRVTLERLADLTVAPFTHGHDVFADGSLLVLPTPGHTPGSISLLVRRPGRPPLLMVGDLSYDADLLELGHVPGVGSRRGLRASTAMINTMRQRDPGLVILPAHDPAAASRLAQATGQVPTLATV